MTTGEKFGLVVPTVTFILFQFRSWVIDSRHLAQNLNWIYWKQNLSLQLIYYFRKLTKSYKSYLHKTKVQTKLKLTETV
jgi:hypothetical protein